MSINAEQSRVSGIRLALVNGSYQSLANLYYLIVRSIFVIAFARIIGVEQYGYYVYSQYWYVLALPLANWGMSELMMAEYARTAPQRRAELVGAGLNLRLILSSIVTFSIMIGAYCFEPDVTLRLLIIIYAQGVFLNGMSNWFSALFVAREKTHYVLFLSAPLLAVEVVLMLFAAFMGADLVTIALLQCGIWWLGLLAACLVYHHRFEPVRFSFSRKYNRYFLYTGPVLALAAFVFSCFGPGLLILYRYLIDDVGQIGEVALAMQVFVILGHSVKVVSNSALPQLNRISTNIERRQAFFAKTIWKQSLYLGGIFFLLCYCMLVPIVTRLIGMEFEIAARMFADNSWLIVPLAIAQGLRLVLISNSKMQLFLLATVLGLAALCMMLIFLHITGSVVPSNLFTALGLSYGIVAAIILVFVQQRLKAFKTADLVMPLIILAISLMLFIYLLDSLPVWAIVSSVALLLMASVVDFRSIYRELAGSN